MKVPAILWDGVKKINGSLYVNELSVDYQLDDFSDTNLEFSLKYEDIKEVNYHELYNLQTTGIEIISRSGRRNVFVVSNVQQLKSEILKRK